MALWHVSMLCSFSGPSNIPHGWATTLFMGRWVLGSRLQVLVCVWGGWFISPKHVPRSGLVGSGGHSKCTLCWARQTACPGSRVA